MALRFLDFPAEIREQVYREVLTTANSRCPSKDDIEPDHYRYHLDLLLVNKQIHKEAKKIFQDNIFVKITTPWPEAIQHIRSEGKVPTVTIGDRAAMFRDFHLWAFIDTPATQYMHYPGSFSMLICLEDLEAFTRMWHFSNLNHFGLNRHLRLKLTVQDPHVPDRKIPKALQSRLLLPFGVIKDLHDFSIEGPKVLESVQDVLNKERAIPDPTPEQCLDQGFALKREGNDLLTAGKYPQALQKYIQSFAAIHITVSGRSRTIHAEGYYDHQELTSGDYKGKRADWARMVLRVELVANVVLTYIKMEDWAEAHFWGKRSIILFRRGITGDESEDFEDGEGQNWFLEQTWTLDFPGRKSMGKIFYRTACASRQLGKTGDVKTLLKAASIYLPHDEKVKQELEALERGW